MKLTKEQIINANMSISAIKEYALTFLFVNGCTKEQFDAINEAYNLDKVIDIINDIKTNDTI